MIPMRSPSMSASSMKWVVRTMVRPSRLPLSMFHVERREYGSMPKVHRGQEVSSQHPR